MKTKVIRVCERSLFVLGQIFVTVLAAVVIVALSAAIYHAVAGLLG